MPRPDFGSLQAQLLRSFCTRWCASPCCPQYR